jgi:hypothetical protein
VYHVMMEDRVGFSLWYGIVKSSCLAISRDGRDHRVHGSFRMIDNLVKQAILEGERGE